MDEIDRDLSKKMAKRVEAKIQTCWRNAWVALYEPEMKGADYVEGWAVNDTGLLIEHGWLELDGKIIDPTVGINPHLKIARYFPGLRFDRDTARAFLEARDFELPIAWGWGHGCQADNGGYRRAFEQAMDATRDYFPPGVEIEPV